MRTGAAAVPPSDLRFTLCRSARSLFAVAVYGLPFTVYGKSHE
jgi:hypothetical protein